MKRFQMLLGVGHGIIEYVLCFAKLMLNLLQSFCDVVATRDETEELGTVTVSLLSLVVRKFTLQRLFKLSGNVLLVFRELILLRFFADIVFILIREILSSILVRRVVREVRSTWSASAHTVPNSSIAITSVIEQSNALKYSR
jgi:hypothetical protein